MMDHIRQFDWCTSSSSDRYFIEEAALDKSNTEKILSNRFIDPLVSSDDDEDHPPNVIDWDQVFQNKDAKRTPKLFVPGMRPVAQYPKLSVLTEIQHHRCLRVLCATHPNILPEMNFHKPTFTDRKNIEILKEVYEKEQKEYIEWAQSLWVTTHCVRALRPKPAIETIYEAEFKVRAQRMNGFPQRFEMAAQIPLECTRNYQYEATLKDTLIDVKIKDLPKVSLPQPILKATSIIRPCTVPEPCHKHPYPFILPTENSVSILPITELHRELAQYAAGNGCKFIASENALRCLMEFNRHWSIPITVCSAFNHEGSRVSVVVLDSEFSARREAAPQRTLRALRHLLERALVPSSETEKARIAMKRNIEGEPKKVKRASSPKEIRQEEPELSSDDEPLGLCIMEDYDSDNTKSVDRPDTEPDTNAMQESQEQNPTTPTYKSGPEFAGDISMEDINDIIGVYNCTCTDTLYEIPPRRSYKKWQITNKSTQDSVDLIVHCAHKARLDFKEVLLEPLPEYQLELGGSELTPDRIRSLTLSLMLRKDASLLKVRVDACNGDLVTLDLEEEVEQGAHAAQVGNVLHTALSELQGLVPGHYILQHEPSHFANALLHVARNRSSAWALNFSSSTLLEPDEAKLAKVAPKLAPVLLPYHKFRHILPCAFSPYENHILKETKKPPTRQKAPPQALKWPRRKKGKKNK